MKTCFLYMVALLLFLSMLSSCDIKGRKTSLEIADPDRHYYPLLRGQMLDIQYEIMNTGENPLFITDIQTSCGCVLVDESSFKVLPAGGNGFIKIKYDSNKNIGYVKHYVTFYANLDSVDRREVTFDLHVVPNALYTRDYEELYKENQEKLINEEALVDGYENQKRYYVERSPW